MRKLCRLLRVTGGPVSWSIHRRPLDGTACTHFRRSASLLNVLSRFYSATNQIDDSINVYEDKKYKDILREVYKTADRGHRVFVLQPNVKWGPKQNYLTTAEHQLAESCTLVDTLNGWCVVGKRIVSVKREMKKEVFGKGNVDDIRKEIREADNVTAVFLNMDVLSHVQIKTLKQVWGVPIFDRYSIVLQIFKEHARTPEAKLQVALAEIPHVRSCLTGFNQGTLDQQGGRGQHDRGPGQTLLEIHKLVLHEREGRIKKALDKLKQNRELLRKERVKRQFPIVAVVGYTNAGKTSLIKAMTGDPSLIPRNILFATLDVTAHAGKLPNNMNVIYMDTVGFISDIPTSLIQSFHATLEDAVIADVIVHVRDISHPDTEAQRINVLQNLQQLGLGSDALGKIVEVCNKIDLLDGPSADYGDGIGVCATSGDGVREVKDLIQKQLETTRLRKTFRIPMNGPHLSWLYKEATVVSAEPDTDSEHLLVKVVLTESAYGRFKAMSLIAKKTN